MKLTVGRAIILGINLGFGTVAALPLVERPQLAKTTQPATSAQELENALREFRHDPDCLKEKSGKTFSFVDPKDPKRKIIKFKPEDLLPRGENVCDNE